MPEISSILQRLTPGPMQVRVFVLDTADPIAEMAIELLSASEQEEIGRLRDANDRRDTSVMRGLLRLGASALTGTDPSELVISRDRLGRPLVDGIDRQAADLNVSRTRGVAALALTKGLRCGVDIERVNPAGLDARFFDFLASEDAGMGDLGHDAVGFFDRFTGLESVLKGDGRGFSDGPGAAHLICCTPDKHQRWKCGGEYWTSSPIQTPPGVVGRVATDQNRADVVHVVLESLGVL